MTDVPKPKMSPDTDPVISLVTDKRLIAIALVIGVIVGGLVIAFVLSGEDTDHA